MDKPKDIVQLHHSKLNINEIVDLVVSPKSGAISTFIGTTRDNFENKRVLKLEYEAYEPMALKEMKNLCAKVRSQWEVDRIAIFHRLGEVPVSEASVVIAISSSHRKESLEAVHTAIDMLKASVPIWKKEIYAKEESQWKENKECSWSSCGSLRSEENDFQDKVKIKNPSEDEEDNSEEKCEVFIDPSIVQVRADSEELNRRIQAFISKKREYVNLVNLQEFCFHGSETDETVDSCARVDAILTRRSGSKSHIKVHRVLNTWGPETTVSSNQQKTKSTEQPCNYTPALEERLSSTEKLLGINKPVPLDIYKRLKSIEDRVLHLESISPEYMHFWKGERNETSNKVFKPVRKRTFSVAELDLKISVLENRYAKKMK